MGKHLSAHKLSLLADRLFARVNTDGPEALSDRENTLFHTYSCIAFMSGARDFHVYFDHGFDAEETAAGFEKVGHRMAAEMIRHAHRIFLESPGDHSLAVVGEAFANMQFEIERQLGAYAATLR